MAEVALSAAADRSESADAVIVIRDFEIRRRWLEVVCDLASPAKREHYEPLSIPGWPSIVGHWTQAIRDAWFDFDRHNPMDAINDTLWQQIESAGLPSSIGNDATGERWVDVWMWSEVEREKYDLLRIDESQLGKDHIWTGVSGDYFNHHIPDAPGFRAMPPLYSGIGTGGDFSQIQTWIDAFQGLTLDQRYTGSCFAEELQGGVVFSGYEPGEFGLTLSALNGAEHDGRAHRVSGKGNARMSSAHETHSIRAIESDVEVKWMEVLAPAADIPRRTVDRSPGEDGPFLLHHCVLHNSDATTFEESAKNCVRCADGGSVNVIYRNIIYGYPGDGIKPWNVEIGSGIAQNTIWSCGMASTDKEYAINVPSSESKNVGVRNNIALGTVGNTQSLDYQVRGQINAFNANVSEDDSAGLYGGERNLTGQDPASLLKAPTTDWTQTDLLTKEDTVVAGIGDNLLQITEWSTFAPEINVSIDNRYAAFWSAWCSGATHTIWPKPVDVNVGTGAMEASGLAPFVQVDTGVQVGRGDVSLEGLRALVQADMGVRVGRGAFALEALQPTIQSDMNIQAKAGAVSLSGLPATIHAEVTVLAALGRLVLRGLQALVEATKKPESSVDLGSVSATTPRGFQSKTIQTNVESKKPGIPPSGRRGFR